MTTPDVSYARKFQDDFILLAQQRESRLMMTVRRQADLTDGQMAYFDRLDAVEMQEKTQRYAPTTLTVPEHSRRRVVKTPFDLHLPIDRMDQTRIMAGAAMPQRYVELGRRAANRKKDDRIIAAATGNAYTVDSSLTATASALPSAQKVTTAGGLTLAKCLSALEILNAADVDDEEPKYAVISAKQLTNLFNTTEVKSSDYNSVKALVNGEIDTWLGFKWIRSERLGTTDGGARKCLFYYGSALGFAMGDDVRVQINNRADLSNTLQISIDMDGDATRIEDEKIVQVDCTE